MWRPWFEASTAPHRCASGPVRVWVAGKYRICSQPPEAGRKPATRLSVRFATRTSRSSKGSAPASTESGMVSARITEMVLRDERAVIPIGSYHPEFDVTVSLPSVVGHGGVQRVIQPDVSNLERQRLQRSADAIRTALSHLDEKESRRKTAEKS